MWRGGGRSGLSVAAPFVWRCPSIRRLQPSCFLHIEVVQDRLDEAPEAMRLRRRTVEHVFGTLKAWMGSSHFLTRTLPRVRTEMSLQVLAYNLKRAIKILGAGPLIAAMRA